jgi:hypothetical protein
VERATIVNLKSFKLIINRFFSYFYRRNLLNKIDDTSMFSKRDLVIEKINKMSYDPKTVNESIIKLHELRFGLV